MKTRIEGGNLPVLTCQMDKGEQIYTECGGMAWMDDKFKMETNTNGGILKGLGRALSGESLFMNQYTCEEDGAEIAFTSCFPGEILEFDLEEGKSIICQKRSFLCAEKSVNMKMEFRKKIGAGFFGGEGFIMQRISGPGKAFIEIDGSVVKKELHAGDVLKVDSGNVVAMTEGISLEVTLVKGVKNMVFGGEGLFFSVLKGEGTVWLQTMPTARLAASLSPYMIGTNN